VLLGFGGFLLQLCFPMLQVRDLLLLLFDARLCIA